MKVSSIALLCVLSVFCITAIQAAPQTVTLTAVKDCTVVKTAPDTAFPSDPNLSAFKADGFSQQFFLWEIRLPADCAAQNIDPATFKFKLAMLSQKLTTQRDVYLNIIKDTADVDVADLNALTFNTAPGVLKDLTTPITTNNIDGGSAAYVGYSTVTVTDGQEWEYVPTGAYLTAMQTQLALDTNQRLIFLYHPRYIHPIGDYWSSLETPASHGPQVEFTYEPTKIAVEQSVDYLTVVEGGATDTYTVYLTSQPSQNVTVALDYNEGLFTANPSSLVFTSSNYSVPQTVTVTAVDDLVARTNGQSIISHTASSADAAFNGTYIPDAIVNVNDNDSTFASITAVKDSTVKRLASGTSFASGDIATKKFNDVPNIDIQVSYIQFQLPQDFQYSVGSTIKLVQTSMPTANDISKVYLIGINDDVDQSDADSFTWLNAPALDTRVEAIDGLNGYDDEQAVYLADLDAAMSISGGVTLTTSATESQAISEWISRDTDKLITIMLIRQKAGSFGDSFASVENATYAAPTLEIYYGTSAQSYCQRPGRVYDPADFNYDCIVNYEDYLTFANDWMQN